MVFATHKPAKSVSKVHTLQINYKESYVISSRKKDKTCRKNYRVGNTNEPEICDKMDSWLF